VSVPLDPSLDEARAADADARLERLELAVYVSLDGVEAAALEIAARAAVLGHAFTVDRARLLRSDVLSRGGALVEALELQRSVADAAMLRGDDVIAARAGCLLASTYYRSGLPVESQEAAESGVRLLRAGCPALWPAEHYMVLALFTSYDRAGAVDFELFEESLRRARVLGEPTLLLAVLNNYAWTVAQGAGGLVRAVALVEEMESLLASGAAHASVATLDTVAWIRLAQGDVGRAEHLLTTALRHPGRVEPDDRAAVLAHLASVRRRQGRGSEAAALLGRARAVALAGGTPEMAILALRELAELAAEAGDYRRAYRRLERFVDEQRVAERVESERRATVLQSIHGTELERDQRRYYEHLATRDALTGLYNRRHLEHALPDLLATTDVAVAMVDVDHFKRINDEHSHDTGDAVLRELAALLDTHARDMSPAGFAVRLGGEEFLVVAPAESHLGAVASLESLRARVQAHDWFAVPSAVRPTISGGLVVCRDRTSTVSGLLGQADELLYAAKRAGRNRVRYAVVERVQPANESAMRATTHATRNAITAK
jgi:two-component system cell cycle response regulator